MFKMSLLAIMLICSPTTLNAESDCDNYNNLIIEGERLTKTCGVCHDMTDSNRKKVGPPLWNIGKREIGSYPGYKYSKNMKDRTSNEGFPALWSEANLNEFLKKPKAFIPGTKMAYAGLKDDKRRATIILYLNSLKDKSE